MEKYKVSVFTCVYNRAHTMHRVFESMKSQTYQNLEHIIVDDGSTDQLDELVENYIKEVDFPVIYLKKKNGGKHTATNVAWDNATGDFIVQLDSDDELLPHAISFLVSTYEQIPDEQKQEYWCVHGRCMDQIERKLVGDLYPENINTLPVEKAKAVARNTSGEKLGLMKGETLVGRRYPTPKFVNFVTEGYLWGPLNKQYRTWYTNEIVRVYYIDEGECLSAPRKARQTYNNKVYYYRYALENNEQLCVKGKRLLKMLCLYIVLRFYTTKEFRKEYPYLLRNCGMWLNALLCLLFFDIYCDEKQIFAGTLILEYCDKI